MDNKQSKKIVNTGYLTHKYGFDNLVELIKENFKNYEDEYLKLRNVYYHTNGIVKFDLIVTSNEMKEEIKDIETSLDKDLQLQLFKKYSNKFNSNFLDFIQKELDIIKNELNAFVDEGEEEYETFASQYYTFTYKKNANILVLEFII